MKTFSSKLLSWYEIHKRDLPWRNTNDPYKIWLSEIILQQTRVAQGLPYYEKFTQNYPTVQDLANSPEDKVLHLWEGLGYYSRARNLHYTAKKITSEFKGIFPKSYDEIIQLKGIGPYTAAAISSFAFNEVKPVIDGNVARVISRIFGVLGPGDSTEFKKQVNNWVNQLIDPHNPAGFNQAIMEFGAIQCTPAQPLCDNCIFKQDCFAFQTEMVESLPEKKKKIKRRNRYFEYIFFEYQDLVFLKKRDEKDIWGGLYEPVLIEKEDKSNENEQVKEILSRFNLKKNQVTELKIEDYKKHILSHQDLYIRFWYIKLKQLPTISNYEPISIRELNKLGMPIVIKNFITKIFV